jgi:hypothetical protein
MSNFPVPHFYWRDLDIDLAVDSIEHPEKDPLVSQVKPGPPFESISVWVVDYSFRARGEAAC